MCRGKNDQIIVAIHRATYCVIVGAADDATAVC